MYSELGSKLRFYRKRSGLSQMGLEIDLGLAFGSISRFENNVVCPSKNTLIKIAKNLKLSRAETLDLLEVDILDFKDTIDFEQLYKEAFSSNQLHTYVDLGVTSKIFPKNRHIYFEAKSLNPSGVTYEIVKTSCANLAKVYARKSNFKFKAVNDIPSESNILLFNNKVVFINLANLGRSLIIDDYDFYQVSVRNFQIMWSHI